MCPASSLCLQWRQSPGLDFYLCRNQPEIPPPRSAITGFLDRGGSSLSPQSVVFEERPESPGQDSCSGDGAVGGSAAPSGARLRPSSAALGGCFPDTNKNGTETELTHVPEGFYQVWFYLKEKNVNYVRVENSCSPQRCLIQHILLGWALVVGRALALNPGVAGGPQVG